jgi:hypothetical protein
VLANGIWGPADTQQHQGLMRLMIVACILLVLWLVANEGTGQAVASASLASLIFSTSETVGAAERCAAAHLIMCSVSQFITIFSPKLLPISPGVGSRAPKS